MDWPVRFAQSVNLAIDDNIRMVATRYQNAPIVEALIDITFEPGSDVELSEIEAELTDILVEDYPHKEYREETSIRISKAAPSVEKSRSAIAFIDQSRKNLFQVGRDRFTFNRLAPYQTWDQMQSEASRLWSVFALVMPPARITRVAVRFLNRFEFPVSVMELKDYFRTYPEISTGAPDNATAFFMRLEIPQKDIQSTAILMQSSIPTQAGTVAIMLDIELFKQVDSPQEIIDPWAQLELLRVRKNEYFETSITERTRAIFGERTEIQ